MSLTFGLIDIILCQTLWRLLWRSETSAARFFTPSLALTAPNKSKDTDTVNIVIMASRGAKVFGYDVTYAPWNTGSVNNCLIAVFSLPHIHIGPITSLCTALLAVIPYIDLGRKLQRLR